MEEALVCRGLSKAYPGFRLHDVSLSLPRGYIMGLIGPNGAGKTTTIKLIMGLARPDAGSIEVLGTGLDGRQARIRERIGFVEEAPAFYEHLSVASVRSIIAPHYDRWDEVRFRSLAEELELPLRARVGSLSRGARTKLAVALALSHHAELLVLDEPTSGLDPVARRRLGAKLQELIGDGESSVLFSTHITSDLERIADYVTFLHRGRVVLSATREEIREQWALVKGPPELALELQRELAGPAFHGLRRGQVAFQVLTSDAAAARRLLGAQAVVEPASLEDIVEYVGRAAP